MAKDEEKTAETEELAGNPSENLEEQGGVNEEAKNESSEASQEVPAGEAPTVESLSSALEEAEAQIAALQKQLEELEPRARAEIQNQRRRAEQEVEKARKYALERFTGELLPIIDSLERAIEACQSDDDAVKALREGVEITHKMFLDGVGKFQVEVVDPKGETFNPEHHQAMSMVESEDAAPNTVVAVMQKGYLLNGRLIRPAMVMVAKG